MKKRLTLILTIVACVIVGLIAASAITLALVKSNFNQVIDTDKIAGITVYMDSKDNYYDAETGAEVFNKIKGLYNEGTKESVLSSIFQGAYSDDAKAEVIPTTTSTSTLKTPAADTIVLKINFKVTMKLVVNGEVQEDSSIYGADKAIYFNTVYLNVENNTTLTKVRCYIVSNTNQNYSYRQVMYATHHSELYNYLKDLDFPG